MLYDLAVSYRVCGSADTDGKMYAAGAAKRRTSLCCPMEVVCLVRDLPASALINYCHHNKLVPDNSTRRHLYLSGRHASTALYG